MDVTFGTLLDKEKARVLLLETFQAGGSEAAMKLKI